VGLQPTALLLLSKNKGMSKSKAGSKPANARPGTSLRAGSARRVAEPH
jgi:hypothetical protein